MEEKLNDTNKETLRSASRRRIEEALSELLPLESGNWFPRGNIYIPNASLALESFNNDLTADNECSFVKYVAASTFGHCTDAWYYLGHALEALLHGDPEVAVHLTYYAELRAAMSLLASEGIFVGNRQHLAIAENSIVKFSNRKGTHVFTWQALDSWCDTARASELFKQTVRPCGTRLSEWTNQFPLSGMADPAINNIFRTLNFDLERWSADRNRRNMVSYNPTCLKPSKILPHKILRLVTEVWEVLEPGGPGSFPIIDDTLFIQILKKAYRSLSSNTSGKSDSNLWYWLRGIYRDQVSKELITSLLGRDHSGSINTNIVNKIFETEPVSLEAEVHVGPMLARAVVLLRIATGSAVLLMNQSHKSDDSPIKEWVKYIGESRGLWRVNETPENPSDLWSDIYSALEYSAYLETDSLYNLYHSSEFDWRALCQIERVPIWSFA